MKHTRPMHFFRENYVYKYSNWDQMKFNIKMSDSWSIISTITGENDQRYGGITSAISGDGHFMAIGSGNNNLKLDRGPVTTYKRTAGNNWVKVGTPIFKGPDRSKFGTSISLSEDGSVMAVGAPGDNGAGSAHIFKLINNVD